MQIAFDIGGTFTDVVFVADDGQLRSEKLLSLLPRVGLDIKAVVAPSQAKVGGSPPRYVHATTIGSNAIIEDNTAPTALVTTKGFRDVLEMRGQRRPAVPDVNWDRGPALIPRRYRFEVEERTLASGEVEVALSRDGIETLIGQLRDLDLEAVAVCLLHAYVNADHERQLATALATELKDVLLSISSEICPVIGEYERTSTTCVNASLMPVVAHYLGILEVQLELTENLLVMQSNGGLMTPEEIRRRPAHIIESGPAAGVLASARLATEMGLEHVLAFDMGGTTAKASAILEGQPTEKPESEVAGGTSLATRFFGGEGHIVRLGSLDIVEVGAGGGSIAWVDDAGVLRVGPQGAGADPGPVCYMQGGSAPTVTDANVVLGFINPSAIAGGTLKIDCNAAKNAIADDIAEPLRLSVPDACHAILDVANATMRRALRAVSIEKGIDPRDFTLVAYGGCGPVHAIGLAESLGITTVVVPILPGLFSALGLLLADYRHDAERSVMLPLDGLNGATVMDVCAELEAEITTTFVRQGVSRSVVQVHREADVEYRHQDAAFPLPISPQATGQDITARLLAAFEEKHDEAYGYRRNDPVDIVTIRVKGTAPASTERLRSLAERLPSPGDRKGVSNTRPVYLRVGEQPNTVPVFDRSELIGNELDGPLIVEQPDTSVVVLPGWTVRVDESQSIVCVHAAALSGGARPS